MSLLFSVFMLHRDSDINEIEMNEKVMESLINHNLVARKKKRFQFIEAENFKMQLKLGKFYVAPENYEVR